MYSVSRKYCGIRISLETFYPHPFHTNTQVYLRIHSDLFFENESQFLNSNISVVEINSADNENECEMNTCMLLGVKCQGSSTNHHCCKIY